MKNIVSSSVVNVVFVCFIVRNISSEAHYVALARCKEVLQKKELFRTICVYINHNSDDNNNKAINKDNNNNDEDTNDDNYNNKDDNDDDNDSTNGTSLKQE